MQEIQVIRTCVYKIAVKDVSNLTYLEKDRVNKPEHFSLPFTEQKITLTPEPLPTKLDINLEVIDAREVKSGEA